MKSINRNISFIFYLLSTYLLILAFRGFEFASGDMVEIINYAKHLQNSSIFSSDFYVNNIAKVIPNERLVFSTIMVFFNYQSGFVLYLLHLITTLLFLWGLYKMIGLFIKKDIYIWLTILVLLGPLYKVNLGGNELFYNMFISSFVAKAFGVWAIYFYLIFRKANSFILILFSTLIHPTVGIQLFIILGLSELLLLVNKSDYKINKKLIFSLIIFILIGGSYIFLLLNAVQNYGIQSEKYFDIFEFRVPHHFFPQYFPLSSYLIEIILFLFGLILMAKYKMFDFLRFSFFIITGIIVYNLGVLIFKIPFVLNTQWFKTTVWLELFSLIAVFKFVENMIKLNHFYVRYSLFSIVGFSAIIWILIINGNTYFLQKPYQFEEGMNLKEEEELGLKVKKVTSINDMYVCPIDFSGFKYYSERNAYIDYKSVVHRGTVLKEWYSRIKEVYQIDINTRRTKKDIATIAKGNYKNIDNEKLKIFKSKGIDFIIQYKEVKLNLPILTKSANYTVYKLK